MTFVTMLAELEESRLYAIKLINVNCYLEEKMIDLNDKIAKVSVDKRQLQVNLLSVFPVYFLR